MSDALHLLTLFEEIHRRITGGSLLIYERASLPGCETTRQLPLNHTWRFLSAQKANHCSLPNLQLVVRGEFDSKDKRVSSQSWPSLGYGSVRGTPEDSSHRTFPIAGLGESATINNLHCASI